MPIYAAVEFVEYKRLRSKMPQFDMSHLPGKNGLCGWSEIVRFAGTGGK
jgi:hypothetical protein